MTLEGAQKTPPVYVNRAELASAFRTSPPTIDRWIADGCPVYERGGHGREYRFSLDAVSAWRSEIAAKDQATEAARQAAIEAHQKQLDLAHGSIDDPAMALPLRLRGQYFADEQKRMDLAIRRRELVAARDCEAVFERVFVFLSDRCQSLPDLLERQCNLTPEAVSEIVQAVDDWQAELARELRDSDILRDYDETGEVTPITRG